MTAAGATFKKLGPKTVVIALSMSAMWGLNIVGIKVALEAFPPIWSAFWRLLLGWPALWLWACCGGVSLRLQAHERRPLAILGVFFGFQIILLNVSISLTSAAFAAVLLNAAPVFINVISHRFVPGDRLSPTRAAGLAVAFLGVAIVLLGKPDASLAPHPTLGNILATATAVVIAGRMVYTQRLVQNIEPTKTIFWQVGFSLPVFLVCASVAEPLTVGAADAEGDCRLAVLLVARGGRRLHVVGALAAGALARPAFGIRVPDADFRRALQRRDLRREAAAGVADRGSRRWPAESCW